MVWLEVLSITYFKAKPLRIKFRKYFLKEKNDKEISIQETLGFGSFGLKKEEMDRFADLFIDVDSDLHFGVTNLLFNQVA